MSGFFDDDDEPSVTSNPGDAHTSTSLRQSSPPSNQHSYQANTSYQSSSRQDTSSHRHETSSRRADTSSRRGAVDTSSIGRGRTPDADELDDILNGMDIDHDGGEGGRKGAERSIVNLQRCLANEQGTPELLAFPTELVEGIVRDLAARVRSSFRVRSGAVQVLRESNDCRMGLCERRRTRVTRMSSSTSPPTSSQSKTCALLGYSSSSLGGGCTRYVARVFESRSVYDWWCDGR